MKGFKKRTWVLLGVIATVAAMASVGAYAWFSAAGSGTGTATVGEASAIVLSSDEVGDLYPGGADVPVTVDIENPGSGAQYVGTISGSVATDDNGTSGDLTDDCLGSWFEVDDIVYNDDLGPGGTDSELTAVRMLNEDLNQNACQGDTLTINWSSN